MSGWLVVFAKEPRAGQVKTRLTPPLTPDQAAALYGCLLDDVLEASAEAADASGLEAILAVHPPEALRELASRAPVPFRAMVQRGSDLAARMTHAVAQAGAAGASPVLLRGSDSPALDAATICLAAQELGAADLVLSPDRDGGYNLVGLRRPAPGLFEHPMSTGSVLRDTLANAGRLGLAARLLPPGFDVDTIEDLRWLAEERRRNPSLPCPRTVAFLDERGLWPPSPSSGGPSRAG